MCLRLDIQKGGALHISEGEADNSPVVDTTLLLYISKVNETFNLCFTGVAASVKGTARASESLG